MSRYTRRVRIHYLCHARFPTEKAYGFQIAQVCVALQDIGHAVTLVCPGVHNNTALSGHAYYGLPRPLEALALPTSDGLRVPLLPDALAIHWTMVSYRGALRRYLRQVSASDLLYVRSPSLLSVALQSGVPVVLELHDLPRHGRRGFVAACNRCLRVVCLTTLMRQEVVSWGVDARRVVVEPDGVTVARFAHLPDASQAKQRWALPPDRPVLGYVGALVTRDTLEKGVAQIIDACSHLRQRRQDVCVWIVGGPDAWVERYRSIAHARGLDAEAIRFQGRVPSADVPQVMAAIDVCLYPAPASQHPFFQRDTSPLKLCEYFAAGKPVVCADLPPLRDLVDDASVAFCVPGDGASMADAVAAVLADPQRSAARVLRGRQIAATHEWTARMTRILSDLPR